MHTRESHSYIIIRKSIIIIYKGNTAPKIKTDVGRESEIQELTLFCELHTSTRAACIFILFGRSYTYFGLVSMRSCTRMGIAAAWGHTNTVFVFHKKQRVQGADADQMILFLVELYIRNRDDALIL